MKVSDDGGGVGGRVVVAVKGGSDNLRWICKYVISNSQPPTFLSCL